MIYDANSMIDTTWQMVWKKALRRCHNGKKVVEKGAIQF